jgi:broad specificity phosphatase PhoE
VVKVPKKIIIFRHGETDHNLNGIVQGWLDVDLNALGVKQAKALAERLKNTTVDVIYSSDLRRAYATAKTVARQLGAKVKKTKLLRERDMGIFTNMEISKATAEYGPLFHKMRDMDDLEWNEHKGESRGTLRARAEKIVTFLEKKHPDQVVMISTHGGFKRELLNAFGFKEGLEKSFDNTSVSIIEKDETGKYSLAILNDTSHLKT